MVRARSGHGARSALEAHRSRHVVLVVDDQPALLYAVARMLRHAGYQTVECSTAHEASTLADGCAAVVMGVNLPDTNGLAACELLKRQPATSAIPVVLMSASIVKSIDVELAMHAGADAYLRSPIEPGELVRTVDRLLGI